jgi:hypothetical protein
MNSNRNLRTVIFAVLALLLAALVPQALRAQDEGCSNSTMKGSYRALAVGTIVGVGPETGVNMLAFYGDGTGEVTGTRSVNGTITLPGTPAPFTYTVNPDCSLTWSLGAAVFNWVVDKSGAGAFYIQASPSGSVNTAQVIRMDKDKIGNDLGCSVSTLRGSYRATGGGTIVGVGPFAQINLVDLDGSGNGEATQATRSTNGVITTGGTSTVTYTVNADCTGTATFGAAHFNIVVDPKGAGWFFIRVDSGLGVVASGQTIRLDEHHEE